MGTEQNAISRRSATEVQRLEKTHVRSIADLSARDDIVPDVGAFPVLSAIVSGPGEYAPADVSRVDRRWWQWIASIAVIGAIIRAAFIWAARSDGPVGDQLFYSAQAIANARGDWFEQPFAAGIPAADHPPMTSLVLTPITWIFEWTGSIVTIQRMFMACIGIVSIVVMAVLGRSVGGRTTGIVCAATTAIYVNVWINDGLIMAESLTFLSTVVLTLVVLNICLPTSRIGHRHFAVAGILVGLAASTRTELISLLPLIVLLFIVRLRSHFGLRRLVSGLALTVVCTCAVLAPWVIWNQLRFEGPVFISTNDGLTIAGANCDSTYFDDVGGWDIWCAYATDIPEGYDAAQASALMRDDGIAYWREHLDRYPVVAAARVARVFSAGFLGASAQASTAEGRPVWLSHLGTVQYWAMIPVAFLGARRRATPVQRVVLLGTVPIVVIVAVIANAYVRFRVPAEVGLVVLFSLGIASLPLGTVRSRVAAISARHERFGCQSNRRRSRRSRVIE